MISQIILTGTGQGCGPQKWEEVSEFRFYLKMVIMDRGAWQATVHRVAESDTTEVTQHICILSSTTWREQNLREVK